MKLTFDFLVLTIKVPNDGHVPALHMSESETTSE